MLDTSTATNTLELDAARRTELSEFLRMKRAGIAPARAGLRQGARRRTVGLRREEVAQLAGISPTWYVWLEQGRDIRPSTDVLTSLASALMLSDAERAHLFTLAQAASPAQPDFSSEASVELRAWMAGLHDQPAYALDGMWNILAWNVPAAELFGDFASVPACERNVLHMIFRWSPWHALFANWECLAKFVVAQFRADTARHAGHPRRTALISKLIASSPEFATLWSAGSIAAARLAEKQIHHPTLGLRTLTYAALHPQGVNSDISVVVYSPLA